ncbi:MAG: LamG-like jellyroll fold domain-containing protein [Bacteroidia bacterium]
MHFTLRFTASLLLSLFLFIVQLYGQNGDELFKTVPALTEQTPDWAVLMYSENPNVWEVDRLFKRYYQNHPFSKTTHTQNYKYWRANVEEWVNDKGFIQRPSIEQERRNEKILKQRQALRADLAKIAGTSASWVNMGPNETFQAGTKKSISWHKNVYAIDQSLSHPDVLICGLEAGGVYKSSDHGLNWSLITKNEVFAGGNGAVKIHPADTSTLLVASNSRIYRSTNSGQTWTEEALINGSGYEFQFHPVHHDTIWCAASNGLYRSNNGGDTWAQVFSNRCWDIDFHPTSQDTMYLLKLNAVTERAELFRSDNAGDTWTLKDNGWFMPVDPNNASAAGGKIGVTPASPDMVYVCLVGAVKVGDAGWIGVYMSEDKGQNWRNPAGQDGGPYGSINGTSPWNVSAYSSGTQQGFYNFDMEVSPTDPAKLWVGTIRLSESADSGRTFMSIGAANSNRLSSIHADIQDIEVRGNEVWVACDGGINHSTDSLTTHAARNKGIRASHFWGFGTGWNTDSYCGGRYHDGTIGWHEGFNIGDVHNIGGVEEASGYVHPIENKKMLFRTNYASGNTSVRVLPDTLGGPLQSLASFPLRPNESYSTSRSSGVYFDPRYANHIYMGLDHIIWKSTNGGVSFDALYTFGGSGDVLEMAISREDPDVMYAVYMENNSGTIHKTIDGGLTWNIINNVPGNRRTLEICLKPEDKDELWVALPNGSNGQKVYRTTNGGGTWTNMSSIVLDGEPMRDILVQGGTNPQKVYVASRNTVFAWDGGTNTWIDYGLGLPLVAKSLKINPFYRDAELRLASAGRGVFARKMADENFAPLAQPITYDDTVYCSRDTVQLDCYSILKHQGASWSWAITPAPQWISNTTDRNPKVVFGTNGSYDVRLTVTDGAAKTSTKAIQNMITVQSLCEADSVPGLSMETSNAGDYVQTGDFGLTNVTHFTMSAWVKPDGIQPNYTGIVFNDGVSAGFNFGQGNNTLQYHWPGGQWWWNSGLVVPADEWSHVAIVANPTGITVYVNGESATHNRTLSPVEIGTMKIGSYKGWSSRNYSGEIDEVVIWNRDLSEAEIRDMRHLTKEKQVFADPSLLAYYQFNEPTAGGKVLDKVGANHAALSGNAALVVSTAPVGGGVSQRLTVNSAATYNFNQVGVEMNFGTGSFPNGEIVVSRIHLDPDSLPNMYQKLDYYWVINNYGSNQTFTALNELTFKPHDGNPSLATIADPSKVRMFVRDDDNEHMNNWIDQCGANTVTSGPNGSFAFSNGCNLNSFSQFQLAAADPITAILPVELLRFDAVSRDGRYVEVAWEIVKKGVLKHFELEYSNNGSQFDRLSTLAFEGEKAFSFEHHKATAGMNHYRLKMVDLDGEWTYSKVKTAWISRTQNRVIAYPNPATLGAGVTLERPGIEKARLYIFDASGKLVHDILVDENETSILVQNLNEGLFFFSLQSSLHIYNGSFSVLR